jgi:hypothetical protein
METTQKDTLIQEQDLESDSSKLNSSELVPMWPVQ